MWQVKNGETETVETPTENTSAATAEPPVASTDTTPENTPTDEQTSPSTTDWTDRQYIEVMTRIRHSEWDEAKAAISQLNEHIKSMYSSLSSKDVRIRKLMDENAKLVADMTTAQPQSLTDESTIDEPAEPILEDIESLWK
jgi:hypothetical protein